MTTAAARSGHQVRVRIANPRSTETTLVLEPWGEVYSLPPGAAYEVEAEGPVDDTLEVTFEADAITIWSWPGSVLRLWSGDAELGNGRERPAVPLASA